MTKFLAIIAMLLLATTVAYAGVEPLASAKDKVIDWVNTEAHMVSKAKAGTAMPTTGLKLSSEYSKTYPAYEQDLGGGLKLYSKIPIPPPIKVWNYEVKTSSRVYYAVNVKQTSEGTTMIGFWATEGNNWKFNNTEMFMSNKSFGTVQVSRAPAYEIR